MAERATLAVVHEEPDADRVVSASDTRPGGFGAVGGQVSDRPGDDGRTRSVGPPAFTGTISDRLAATDGEPLGHTVGPAEGVDMAVEFEGKVLDVDPAETAAAILAAGGRHRGEMLLRRYVYDIVPGDTTRWIRLRDNGSVATLAVKEIAHDGVDGTVETEIVVDDFDTAAVLLARAGHIAKSYQENRRDSYSLDEVRLEIDSWPLIPPYLEIEGDTAGAVHDTARRLGIDPDRLTGENTTKVYARYGIDLTAFSRLDFNLTGP